jgi:hypothetical protein
MFVAASMLIRALPRRLGSPGDSIHDADHRHAESGPVSTKLACVAEQFITVKRAHNKHRDVA